MTEQDERCGFKLLGIILSVVFLVFVGACGMRRSSANDSHVNEKCYYLGGYELSKAALHDQSYKDENDEKISEEIQEPRVQENVS